MIDDDTFIREMGHVNDKLDDMKDVQKEFIGSCNERFKDVEAKTDGNTLDIARIDVHRKWAGRIATTVLGILSAVVIYNLTRAG